MELSEFIHLVILLYCRNQLRDQFGYCWCDGSQTGQLAL